MTAITNDVVVRLVTRDAATVTGPVPPGAAHLDGPAAGALARETGAGRMLLTHLLMGRDPAATLRSVGQRFRGPVELVEPGFETEI